MTEAQMGLLVNEVTAVLVSQREGRYAAPPETTARDIIDRVLRKLLPRETQTIDVTPSEDPG